METIRIPVKTAIKEAFLNLLEKKDFERITVKEICALAGVGRSTFYLYFKKIDDIVADVLDDMFSRIDPSCTKYLDYRDQNAKNGTPPPTLRCPPRASSFAKTSAICPCSRT